MSDAHSRPHRLAGSGEDVGRGLGRLVVTLLEVIRQVVERQAVRRVEVGDLTEEEIERLGQALMDLETTFDELIEHFGVEPNDIYLPIDLGALVRHDPAVREPLQLLSDPTRRTP